MAESSGSARWLHGPVPDLLLGCGLIYAVYFAAALYAGPQIREVAPETLLALGTLVLGAPHYGATLLRVYEDGKDRREYRFFGTWASLLVAVVFAIGVYDVRVGSWMLTLYLSWSPWHYSGQNYGIAAMFLGRRGVPISKLAKRCLHATFQLSWAMVLLAIHSAVPSASYAPVELAASDYVFIPLGIPTAVAAPLLLLTAITYLVASAIAIALMRQAAGWRDLLPTLALMLVQAFWFSIPVLARATATGTDLDPFDPRYADYTFYWIAFGHFIQYLWVTVYFAKSAGSARSSARYLGKSLLVGSAIWGAPLALFAPEVLGVRAFDAGLGVLIASAVNIHHFILDGAIWKLRKGAIARILLRAQRADAEPALAGSRFGRIRWMPLVLAVGLASALGNLVGTLEAEFGFRRAALASDLERLKTAAARLRWVGRDPPALHTQIALFEARAGRLAEAIREVERSLALQSTAESWTLLGELHARNGDAAASRLAHRRARELQSGSESRPRR
ncbi:MAG TPA: hypothetical protein VEC18_06845 [Myxococcota bacterium]|nr:hypothetical protein [Myxococcota bacterium]